MSIEEKIKEQLRQHKIILYMKGTPQAPQCGFSAMAADCLNKAGAKFHTVNILEDNELRQGLKKFSNWPTYPQLYVNGKLVGGSDIVKELADSGELKKLVEA